jgi:hypothetical protein
MATSTIDEMQQYFEGSHLAAAAYATMLSPDMSHERLIAALAGSEEQNIKGIGFTLSQAESFAAHYEVLAPTFEGPMGSQANLFRDRVTGEEKFTIAGTQPFADPILDIVIADAQIALGQVPKEQMLEIINYYQRAVTPAGQSAPQAKLVYEDDYRGVV